MILGKKTPLMPLWTKLNQCQHYQLVIKQPEPLWAPVRKVDLRSAGLPDLLAVSHATKISNRSDEYPEHCFTIRVVLPNIRAKRVVGCTGTGKHIGAVWDTKNGRKYNETQLKFTISTTPKIVIPTLYGTRKVPEWPISGFVCCNIDCQAYSSGSRTMETDRAAVISVPVSQTRTITSTTIHARAG